MSLKTEAQQNHSSEVGDFMQMNLYEILLGFVSQCTISRPVGLFFIVRETAPV